MANKIYKNTVSLSKEEYLKLLEAYKKMKEVFIFPKIKKPSSLKSLYGIWKGVKVDEKDFKEVKRSLFKTSL